MTIMESSQQSTTCENEQKRSNTEDVSLITETAKLKLNDSNGSTQKINTTKKDSKNAKKSGKSGKLPKELITPEYIEKMRKEREEKKRLKREQLIAQGIDPDNINKTTYIKREMLEVPHSTKAGKKSVLTFKIMTYNLLAQALIRRTLFPNNGDILKWQKRSKVLIQEIKDYDCDILCLQEVDFVQYKTFWRPELEKLGYHTKFNRGMDKNHGISIFFKSEMFSLLDTCSIDFDKEKSGDIQARTTTKNAGLMVGLALKDDPTKVVTIGTAHLFWHPFGTYERTRQTYVVLSKSKEFENRIKILHPSVKKVWRFFAGDFNSQPFDAPYLSITSKPVKYDSRCERVISCSTSFQYSTKREGGSGEDEEGGNIEKFGEDQPKDPVPDTFKATDDQKLIVQQMEDLHNELPLRAISLYSVGYKSVDPKNAGLDNERNEPFFSNWANTWRGLLDYIFIIKDWDIGTDKREVDSICTFETENDVRINKLLKLPHPDEMGLGQPRENEYPSDHLCMIADISLLD
jgi:RNA exonuclease NGL2